MQLEILAFTIVRVQQEGPLSSIRPISFHDGSPTSTVQPNSPSIAQQRHARAATISDHG
jgi:hypothetical protein